MKTFNEIWEWLNGYLCRAHGDDRDVTALVRLNNLKSAHERELAAAKAEPPLVEYDVVGNARHKAACALRGLGDEQLEEKSLYESVRAFYEALNDEYPTYEVSAACVLKTIRDRLIVLLES